MDHKILITKDVNQLHPEVYMNGKLVFATQVVVYTWTNGSGNYSEHVEATINVHGEEKKAREEDVHVDVMLHCGLRIRSTNRGLGCFCGTHRICLIQKLKYTAHGSSLPTLVLEMVAS